MSIRNETIDGLNIHHVFYKNHIKLSRLMSFKFLSFQWGGLASNFSEHVLNIILKLIILDR